MSAFDQRVAFAYRIVAANIAEEVTDVAVRNGVDPRDFTLVAFGGAGGLHAVELAAELGMQRVVIPRAADVFSAWGMLMSDLRRDYFVTRLVSIEPDSASDLDQLLLEVAAAYKSHSGLPIVEPAHMELAEPSIATAFARCVEQGAVLVVVVPYFLGPGKHWNEDIPRLAAEAAARHPGVGHFVADPLGLHPLLLQIVDERIREALGRQHA